MEELGQRWTYQGFEYRVIILTDGALEIQGRVQAWGLAEATDYWRPSVYNDMARAPMDGWSDEFAAAV